MHYNGPNSYLFVKGTEIIKFKAKDSEIVANPLCLQNISEDFSEDNMKKTGLYRYVYDFSVDYRPVAVRDIPDIHKYLMEKNNMMFEFIKKVFLTAMTFFSFNSSDINSLECVLMNNQECKIRTKIVDVNNNEPTFYPYSIKINKCCGSYNVNDPYAKSCQKLMKQDIEWHETCKCKCRLDASVCNNIKRWNEDKCRCECKELIDKGICDKEFI